MNKIIRFTLSLYLVLSFFIATAPQIALAQTAAQTQVSSDIQSRIAKIEERVEARRKELGIPGMSLAIVKNGEIVLTKGFGYKSFEKQVPVTADTQFAIGSATKAFTGLSVLMSQDEDKVSLDEHPRKYLPYFKINDSEINEKITVRNLLTHSSGLGRTDLAMITGKLTREELIKVAGEAKPVAKLGEQFGYQNIMYAAAGEIVAKVQKMTWENFVAQKILKPLGMMNSSISVAEMQKAKDYSFGYDYNFDTKQTRLLPTREIAEVSPAGSINSSARDMANWLKFVLNKGEFDGKRLVSEKGFEEWLKPHQKITPDGKVSYALGWFVQDWKGKKVIQHGGNIDGFNSMVAMIPEENLGFVMLTNVTGSTLGNELMQIIWSGILDTPDDKPKTENVASAAPEKEVGKYKFVQAGFDIDVKMEEGKLKAFVPNQPTYVLENVGGRKYKLTGAPDGFFITFKDTEAFLEQPQGNYTLPKAGANIAGGANSEAVKELIGKYQTPDGKGMIEVKEVEGKTSLVVGNQPPYPLVEKAKDEFRPTTLPDSYSVKVKRNSEGKIETLTLVQPEGEFSFKYLGGAESENQRGISGTYKLEQPPNYNIEISQKDGKIFLQVPNQPLYELKEKEKDIYFSPTIPDVLSKIEVRRDAGGNVIKLISTEPGGTYSFSRITVEKPKIAVDELMAKTITALGGEENWRKLNSRVTKIEMDFVHQGLKGIGTTYEKAPNMAANNLTINAGSKQIATTADYFDGAKGFQKTSFSPSDTMTGERLEDAKISSDFYGLANWKKNFKEAKVEGTEKVGEEEAHKVIFKPEKGNAVTYFISTKTFLPLKRNSVIASSTSSQKIPQSMTFEDYREVDGIMIPFKSVTSNPGMGEIIVYVKDVKHNVKIDDKQFKP